MTFDLEKITESKERYRRKLAALPFGEKLRILDRMRKRDNTLRRAQRAHAAAPTIPWRGEPATSPPGRRK
jgi:hypothetical protein